MSLKNYSLQLTFTNSNYIFRKLIMLKTVEDFECEKCHTLVKGDGYTNHCPNCLWSKHVDLEPGDRLSNCGGMMKPVSVEQKGGEWTIKHTCIICSHQKNNKVSKDDNFDELIKITNSLK